MDTPTNEVRRLGLLGIMAAGIGIASGGAAWGLVKLIALITNVTLFHRVEWTLPPSGSFPTGPGLVIAALVGSFLVALLAVWAPIIKGHGLPEAMEAVLSRDSRIKPRTAIAKPLSAAIAIGTGGPFGAEGPIIVTGGAIGSLLGQVIPVSNSERKILLATGAAAGMTAIFGSPLAAVVLVIELLLFEYSTRALVSLLIGTGTAAGMHVVLFGSESLFPTVVHDPVSAGLLPVFALLGLLCGGLAVVIAKGLFAVEAGFRRLPVPEFWHPVIGAAGFVAVGFAVPGALGVGYDQIHAMLLGELAGGALAALFAAKLVAWWVALGSGTSGGTLAPILLISGCFGALVGNAVVNVAPGLHLTPGLFALAAMAATFGSATRTPFASVIFLVEITRDLDAAPALLVATVVALLVTRRFLADSIMTEKLARRGLRVHGDYEADRFKSTTVATIMTADPVVLHEGQTRAEVCEVLASIPYSAFPVVDADGRAVGVVTRDAALGGTRGDEGWPEPLDPTHVVAPGVTVDRALRQLVDQGLERLVVVDADDRVVGILTRTDVLHAKASHADHDIVTARRADRA